MKKLIFLIGIAVIGQFTAQSQTKSKSKTSGSDKSKPKTRMIDTAGPNDSAAVNIIEITSPMEVPSPGEDVFYIVEEPATFHGKDINEFIAWIASQIKYPREAIEKSISGRVFVQFVIDKTGKVTNARIIRGVDLSLDREAIRVVESSPLWAPAKQGGVVVRQQILVPVKFELPKN